MLKCTQAKRCGGCAYIDQGYEASLKAKNAYLQKLYKPLHIKIHPIICMEDPYHYRNKAIIAFNSQYQPGLYEESSHRIIPYTACLLHDEKIDEVIQTIGMIFKKYHVSLYDPRAHKGEIRHVVLRRGVVTHEIMVTLVSTSDVFKGAKNFAKELVKKNPEVKTIILNINKRRTPIVLGEKEKILYGKGYIVDELCGLSFKISSQSFYQINHDQCERLYQHALSSMSQHQIIVDTYCGIGTIGMIAAKKAKQVFGVELNGDAIQDAQINKAYNQIKNIRFFKDDATKWMQRMVAEDLKVDAIIMDPPRTGSTPEFIAAVKQMKPAEIIYISCNPETQVRDLKHFKNDYTCQEIYAFDMFPFTKHVESVVLLTHRKDKP